MIRAIKFFSFVAVVLAADSARAQDPAPAAAPATMDSAAMNAVTTFAIKSGKIAMTSVANPKPSYLPDGTYTNEDGTILVILDGQINRVQTSAESITPIANVHLKSQRVYLTPETNALMSVSDMPLPSGTFTSEDKKSSMSVMAGKPVSFTIPAPASGKN